MSKIGYVLICYGLSDAVFSAAFGHIMHFIGKIVLCSIVVCECHFMSDCILAVSQLNFHTMTWSLSSGGRPPLFAFGAAVNLATITLLFTWRPSEEEAWVFFLVGFLWGMADAIWQTQINGTLKNIQGLAKRWAPGCVNAAGEDMQQE